MNLSVSHFFTQILTVSTLVFFGAATALRLIPALWASIFFGRSRVEPWVDKKSIEAQRAGIEIKRDGCVIYKYLL